MNFHNWGNQQSGTPQIGAPASSSASGSTIYKELNFSERVKNRIYFYSGIYADRVLTLNRQLREISNEMSLEAKILEMNNPPDIFLHIFSYGGDILAGLSALDNIVNCSVPVNTIIDGGCASAATFLSVVGKKRYMFRHSFILIHQISSCFWGKYEEFEDEKRNLDKFMQVINDIYGQYTKLPKEKLSEILKHDLWFTADEALEYGMIDKII